MAHADVDCFYGQHGGGGKGFWEKVGFRATKSYYFRPEFEPASWQLASLELAEKQGREKGMTQEDVNTWNRMVYEL